MKTPFNWIAWVCVSALLFTACKKNDETPDDQTPVTEDYATGAYVINEGSFLQNNASITHISPSGTVTSDVYYAVNGVELGDVFQSFTIIGDNGYAVLNNSQKIEVVDMKTMQNEATITGLSYPRYMVETAANTAYVSNGSLGGTLEVINLQTHAVTGSIAVGNGPGRLLKNNNEVWVCNEGGFGLDSTITIVNALTNLVVDVVEVAHRPTDIVADALGNIWVLCAGETYYDVNWNVSGHSPAQLYRIDASTHAVISSVQMGALGQHPTQLEISPDGTVLYYENEGIFKFDLINGDLPGVQLVSTARSGLSVHPSTGEIWCASISDFTNPSTVYVYSAAGSLMRSFTAGIGTNGVRFK